MVRQMVKFPGGFSVLICVYKNDSPIVFDSAIKSILSNELIPDQIVLVVDGPISQELDLIVTESARDFLGLFDVIRLPFNQGLAKALNAGLEAVKFKWVVRADADDINLPNRFSTLSNFIFKNPECDILSSYILEIDGNGNYLHERRVPVEHEAIKKYLRWRSPFNHMAVAYKKDLVVKVGGYPDVYLKEDYALWYFVLECGRSANIPMVLVHATAGSALYKRRGGIKYVLSEAALQKLLYKSGCKSFCYAIADFFIRSVVFVLPSGLRGVFYSAFLRNKSV